MRDHSREMKEDRLNRAIEGCYVYVNYPIIHRDPAVYGENANEFFPERWLNTKDGEGAKVPAGSWRGFERGRRNCLGQELANIEARVIVVMVAHRYDLSKSSRGELDLDEMDRPTLNDKGQCNVNSEMYNVS
ncbi:unnamed protein product [Clonostachys solani]|uniref:Cytochrome P450 n=1 Tax=Clonostachys solani TaxID=160281 RepID=A0A9N9ZIA7_9HYPO|nr:unnamed protein product [Clonostachys solani]